MSSQQKMLMTHVLVLAVSTFLLVVLPENILGNKLVYLPTVFTAQ